MNGSILVTGGTGSFGKAIKYLLQKKYLKNNICRRWIKTTWNEEWNILKSLEKN